MLNNLSFTVTAITIAERPRCRVR